MALSIIGAGLGRTGTASLKLALERLGFGRCYHMSEALSRPADPGLWINAADGAPDWDTLFEGYGAAVDFPVCAYWRELSAYYPSAKVILSVRDAGKWYDSTQKTILSPVFSEFLARSPFGEMIQKTVWNFFGGETHDRAHLIERFESHIEEVKRGVSEDRLLVFEAKQGWEALCAFLELPIPDAPYPRVNSREETASVIQTMITQAGGDADEMRAVTDRIFE